MNTAINRHYHFHTRLIVLQSCCTENSCSYEFSLSTDWNDIYLKGKGSVPKKKPSFAVKFVSCASVKRFSKYRVWTGYLLKEEAQLCSSCVWCI